MLFFLLLDDFICTQYNERDARYTNTSLNLFGTSPSGNRVCLSSRMSRICCSRTHVVGEHGLNVGKNVHIVFTYSPAKLRSTSSGGKIRTPDFSGATKEARWWISRRLRRTSVSTIVVATLSKHTMCAHCLFAPEFVPHRLIEIHTLSRRVRKHGRRPK